VFTVLIGIAEKLFMNDPVIVELALTALPISVEGILCG
jgi:hypothetical protein